MSVRLKISGSRVSKFKKKFILFKNQLEYFSTYIDYLQKLIKIEKKNFYFSNFDTREPLIFKLPDIFI